MRRRPIAEIVVAVLVAVLGLVAASTGPALGVGPDDDVRPFYRAPATLPARDGDVIRSEHIAYRLDPQGAADVALTSTRMLYRSTDRTGTPIAVSGSVLVPRAPWLGPGGPARRPVVGYAVGTQGLGDRCAPSRQLTDGIEYEGVFMAGLLARGYALAVTDYEGLGTAGLHTYTDRVSQGHAVLDVVRAAQRLSGTGVGPASPVGLVGYSQGGGATASAVELAASYAPELRVRGAVAGAVPADLATLPEVLDGTLWAEFAWFAIAGLSASHDVDLGPLLNPAGRAFLAEVSDDCVFDLARAAFRRSERYTADGSSLAEISARSPFRGILAAQRLGRRTPAAPVLVTHSVLDDTIPYALGRQLARDWCARGATVRLSTSAAPAHIGGMIPHSAGIYGYLEARFAGLPAASSCWRL